MNVLQAHARAILDLLDADDAAPPLQVLHSQVKTGQTLPYVLVYFRLHTPSGGQVPQNVSLESTSDVIDTWAYCHSVSGDPFGALGVAGRVRAALLGKTPAVTGRACYPISHDDGRPAERDERLGTAVFDQVDVYAFRSQPA